SHEAGSACQCDAAPTCLHAPGGRRARSTLRGARPRAAARQYRQSFRPVYVLDAIGVTSRAIYPDARIWRPLMERMLSDITPGVNKIYVALNRLLAKHEVLPEISAALRARSELRPADDADLLPAFK